MVKLPVKWDTLARDAIEELTRNGGSDTLLIPVQLTVYLILPFI